MKKMCTLLLVVLVAKLDRLDGIGELLKQVSSGQLEQVSVSSLPRDEAALDEKDSRYGWSSLHWAVARNNERVVRELLDAGAKVEARGNNGFTPLHIAAQQGYPSFVELLISRGADINVQDESGRTPLHRAIEMGRENMVKALLGAGADKDLKDNDGRDAKAFSKYMGRCEGLIPPH